MSGIPYAKPRAGAFDVRYLTGRGYGVFAPSGALLHVYGSHTAAQERQHREQLAADSKARRGPRKCLCCGHSFQSEGIHNRLCDPCRRRGLDVDGTVNTVVRGRRKVR